MTITSIMILTGINRTVAAPGKSLLSFNSVPTIPETTAGRAEWLANDEDANAMSLGSTYVVTINEATSSDVGIAPDAPNATGGAADPNDGKPQAEIAADPVH